MEEREAENRMILAIDPGDKRSAYMFYDGEKPVSFGLVENDVIQEIIKDTMNPTVVVEMIASYGMAVGAEVFETCVWIGRFLAYAESKSLKVSRLFRKDVKLNLCGQTKAKDANIRQALIDRFGGPESIKKGGPLYKIKADEWAALAVAVTYCDQQKAGIHA